MQKSDSVAKENHIQDKRGHERNVYSMNNPHTTEDEKVEIEVWYQLPIDLSGIAYIISCLFWARGDINGYQAYAISFSTGILTAVVVWFIYVKRIVFGLEMLINFPVVSWLIHLGFALWLYFTGSWMQAIFITFNRLLLLIPVGFGAVLSNQILTLKYKMHPKYAFLKHVYGKTYSFESS